MRLVPSTFNSHNIQQSGTIESTLIAGPHMPEVDIIDVKRTSNAPSYGGKIIKGRTLKLQFDLKGDADTQIDTLLGWFDTRYQPLVSFVCNDTNNSKLWQVQATAIEVPKWNDNAVEVRLWTPDPVWRSVTQYSGTITGSGTAFSGTITTAGNVDAFPVIEITGVSYPTGGYGYREYIDFVNNSPMALINEPLCLGTTINSGTLVSQGKVQADGDDYRVFINGAETNRWLDSWNSGTSKVWINIDAQPYTSFTITEAISNIGTPTFITAKAVVANTTALARMATANGRFKIANEEWTYQTLNRATRKFTGLTRSVRNTSAASSSAGATAVYLDVEITVLHGNSAATAPDTDDTKKPIIDLNQSTNLQHVYTEFRDEAGLRSGIWSPALLKSTGQLPGNIQGTATQWYSGNQGTTEVYPATDMGMNINSYYYGTLPKAESADIEWRLYVPFGGTSVTSNGEKYISTLASAWPAKAELESSANGIAWTVEKNNTKPGTAAVWTTWTDTAQAIAISGGAYYLRFHFAGALSPIANVLSYFEVDAVTVLMNSSKAPTVTFRTEEQNYWFSAIIGDTTTSESIEVNFPMTVGTTLYIDTDGRTVTYQGGSYLAALNLQREPARAEWLRLQSGANLITLSTDSGGTISLVFKWYDRQNG